MVPVLTLLVVCCGAALGADRFDQRQSGQLNVQVEVRNAEILALLSDYETYEDYEDYEESSEPASNVTLINVSSLNETEHSLQISPLNGTSFNETEQIQLPNVETQELNSQPDKIPSGRRRCGQGFFRDRRGRCRRIQPSSIFPFSLRLIPRRPIS